MLWDQQGVKSTLQRGHTQEWGGSHFFPPKCLIKVCRLHFHLLHLLQFNLIERRSRHGMLLFGQEGKLILSIMSFAFLRASQHAAQIIKCESCRGLPSPAYLKAQWVLSMASSWPRDLGKLAELLLSASLFYVTLLATGNLSPL